MVAHAESSSRIRIVAVLGTARPGNYTGKALALVVDEIRKHPDIHVDVIDSADMRLVLPGADDDTGDSRALKELVARATGVVLSTPEYHGSFSSVLKLLIENLGFPSALAGKPVALLGVAAGQIGAIKSLEQLRSVCSHVGAIVLPGPISVPRVQQKFDADGACLDVEVERQIRHLATNLIDYIGQHVCPRFALEEMVRRQD